MTSSGQIRGAHEICGLDLEVQRQQQAANRQQRDLDRGSER